MEESRGHTKVVPLRDDVASGPSLDPILQVLVSKLDVEPGEVLGEGRAVQADLHRHLHHDAAPHEGGIRGRGAHGKGPSTEQAQGLDDVRRVRNLPQRGPDQPRHLRRERREQGRISPTGDGDDGPEQQRAAVVVVVGRLASIQQGKQGVVRVKKPAGTGTSSRPSSSALQTHTPARPRRDKAVREWRNALVEELGNPIARDDDAFERPREGFEAVRAPEVAAPALETLSKIQQRRHRFVRPHAEVLTEGQLVAGADGGAGAGTGTGAGFHGRPRHGKRWRSRAGGRMLGRGRFQLSSQLQELSFHLGVATSLSDALEGGLNLALELQPPTSGALRERILHDVTSELAGASRSALEVPDLVRGLRRRC